VFYAITFGSWTTNGFLSLDPDAGTIMACRMCWSSFGVDRWRVLHAPNQLVGPLFTLDSLDRVSSCLLIASYGGVPTVATRGLDHQRGSKHHQF
jgi:hypothetical protein